MPLIKYVLLLPFVTASSTLCSLAQQSVAFQQCSEKGNSQSDLNKCADEEARRADQDLNSAYQRILERVRNDARVVAAIRSSERAWLEYRRAYMNAMYPKKDKQTAYGSFFPMEFELLEASLIREHTQRLNDLLQQYAIP